MEMFTERQNEKLNDVESSVLVNIVKKWSKVLNDTNSTSLQKNLAWDHIETTFNKATYDEKKPRRSVKFLKEHMEGLKTRYWRDTVKATKLVPPPKISISKKSTTKRAKLRKQGGKVNGLANNEQIEDSPRCVNLLGDEKFRDHVLARSIIEERLMKKEIELRMEHSKETHAKAMEIMELKRKALLVELNRHRATAHDEKRRRRARDGQTDGDEEEAKKNSAHQDSSTAVERNANEIAGKKRASGFKGWWKSLFGRRTKSRTDGPVTGKLINQQSQERSSSSDYIEGDGEQLATAEVSEIKLHPDEEGFKNERMSKWLAEELPPNIIQDDCQVSIREDGDSGVAVNLQDDVQHGKASCKKKLIESFLKQLKIS